MAEKSKSVLKSITDDLALRVLDQLPTPVFAVDLEQRIIFMNKAGCSFLGMEMDDIRGKFCYDLLNSQHCGTEDCRMKKALTDGETCTARNEVSIGGRSIPIEYTVAPLLDDNGNIIGSLEYAIDITERVRDEKRIREQTRTIQDISTPAISLWEGIIVLPVLGIVDSMRAKQMMNTMLNKIKETSAKTIILDIQGVAAVDTAVSNHLIKITKATKLMGCRCIISGISPAVAESLVQLGIDLGDVATNSSLRDALGDAFTLMNIEVKKLK